MTDDEFIPRLEEQVKRKASVRLYFTQKMFLYVDIHDYQVAQVGIYNDDEGSTHYLSKLELQALGNAIGPFLKKIDDYLGEQDVH